MRRGVVCALQSAVGNNEDAVAASARSFNFQEDSATARLRWSS